MVVSTDKVLAEFYLKGFLVLHHIEPPRTHDLTKLLLRCCSVRPGLTSLRGACATLTQYYIEARYPPDVKSYTKPEAEEAVRYATQVRDSVTEGRLGLG